MIAPGARSVAPLGTRRLAQWWSPYCTRTPRPVSGICAVQHATRGEPPRARVSLALPRAPGWPCIIYYDSTMNSMCRLSQPKSGGWTRRPPATQITAVLAMRNQPLGADSGFFAVWRSQCRSRRSVVGRGMLIAAVCRAWRAHHVAEDVQRLVQPAGPSAPLLPRTLIHAPPTAALDLGAAAGQGGCPIVACEGSFCTFR